MSYEVSTIAGSDGRIISTIDEVGGPGIRVTLFRHVMDTRDAQVCVALEALGWRHDGGIAALDVPNSPSVQNPIGNGYHRVTAADVVKMEERLRQIAKALHL